MIFYTKRNAAAQVVTVNFLNFIFSGACFSEDKLLFPSFFLKRDTIKRVLTLGVYAEIIYTTYVYVNKPQVYSYKEAPHSSLLQPPSPC
jgi:hypothetical protein